MITVFIRAVVCVGLQAAKSWSTESVGRQKVLFEILQRPMTTEVVIG